MRRPGIEPGSTAWKAAMLTTIPPTLVNLQHISIIKQSYYCQFFGRNFKLNINSCLKATLTLADHNYLIVRES